MSNWWKDHGITKYGDLGERSHYHRKSARRIPLYPIEHLGTPTEIIDLWNQGEYSDIELAAERVLDFIAAFGFCSKRYAWLLNICHISETERMLQIQSQFRNLTEKKQDFCQSLTLQAFQAPDSLNVYYKSFRSLISTETTDSIISSESSFWTELWAEVAARMPSLQKLEVRHEEINKRSFSHGYGSLEAAKQLDQNLQELGIGLRAGVWRVREETDGPTPSQQLLKFPSAFPSAAMVDEYV